MPSTATITSFITMVAGTKARASHVNTNFDNIRGHLLPINTDTQTASDQTHDLGASDHQWRSIYIKNPPYINGNQLGKMQIQTVYDGSSPTDLLEDPNWLARTSFPKLKDSGIGFQFIVPDEYVQGNRISLSLRGYCETTGAFELETGASLFRNVVTDASVTLPTNVLTSTSDITPPSTHNQFFTNTSLRLTTASGTINSVTVGAGDVIACYLKRRGTALPDTNTGYFFLTNINIDLNN